MPEAVTTQGETLWIGTNRSAMRRVPYLVSSPEIAGPVSPIDATNLASDARVYIPGLKDYSGDLVWEANSQYYRPGELRDLLAMDGCKVYAERRMPLVGTRVSLEGTASVTMSAASPDSVQRVTVRITPSSAMSVEEWSPSMSDGYMIAIKTDAAGMNVLNVQASYGGRPLETVVTSSTRQAGAANIPEEWSFNGGTGPFGCFYAAFNIDAYVAGTESEEPVCTEAGRLAYRLDPFDLGRTLAGTDLVGTYNVMLVIPTVYWTTRSALNTLYLSSSPRYRTVTNMVAYAHTATLPGGGTKVYPYIAIGVYEAATDGTRLLSIPGQAPAVSRSHDGFKALADALTSAGTSDFQQWNFYQWTLFKMMAYTVMGTKNSQWMLGSGPASTGVASVTGLSEDKGPYAQSGTSYDKVFLENTWGSCWNVLGNARSVDCELFVGQTLGGADLLDTTAISIGTFPDTAGATRWPTSASTASATWDVPTAVSGTSTASDPATPGDAYRTSSGSRQVHTGGGWSDGVGAGVSNLRFQYTSNDAQPYFAARLSAFLDEYAMGLTDEAPAALSMSAPLSLSMGQSTPDEEEAEEPEEESAEPTEEPEEESAEPTEEPTEEPEETPEESDTIEEDMR